MNINSLLRGVKCDCVRLMEDLRKEGITNIVIELDMSQLSLMCEAIYCGCGGEI